MASNAPPSVDTSGAFAAAPEDDAEPRLAQLQRLAGVDVASGVSSSCGGVVVTADAAWFRASNAQSLCVAAEVAGRTRAALLARLHVPGRGAAAGALNAATQRVLAAAPARLHLCCGGSAAWGMPGAALAVAAPCVESALAAMCCAALAGGDSGCVAAAAPALGAALRDALLGVSLQTGRSALCGGGGAPHVRVRDLHAAALLALSPAAGAPLAPRALWAEALSHCLLAVPWGGPAALLRLCRAMVTHGDVAAALEDAAHGALRPRGFAAALQAWARSTLRAEAAAYQTGWLGGAGALSPAAAAYLAADPDAAVSWLDYSPPASRNGVRPATLRANLAWLATLMATEKPRDLAWCLAAVGFNAAWAIFAPLIISDIITIAPAIAAAAADGAPLEPLRLLHGGMMPDYTVYAGRNAANALAILAGAFGGGAAVSAHMNRQLSARSVGNPGFGLGARAALARRLAAAPGLLADTAGLAAAARAAQHDAHLVGAATSATFTAANALGQLALALALMFLINARMAGFFLATLPVTALLTGLQGRASGQLSATLKTRQEALEVAADAALLCAGAAAGSGTHDTAVAAAGVAAEAAADEISVAAAVLQQYVAIVSGGLMAFLLGLGGQQMAAGRLDVGLFVAFISAAGAAAPQVPALVEAVRAWRVAGRAAALLRGADAVRAPPAPALDDAGAETPPSAALLAAAPALAARGVAFAYARSPSRALVAASFDLPGGAKCVLVGRSGAGKTTLLRLLAGRYLPSQGALLADGAPLAAAARAAGPGGVAFAPAEPMLFAGSVADNIAMGLPSAVIASLPDGGQARVAAAAKAAGLIGDGTSVSLATRVGGAGALSSGQRQRIGIARALASQAPLLLLDEPTSNADSATAAALVAALVALGDGCTVVAATNAPALFESGGFSHGMCIAGATVAEAGPLDALVAARGAYARTAAAVGVACDASAPLAPAALRAALWPLAAASDAECALLAPLLAPRTLPAGTTLFAAGTAPAAAFVLARGRVELRSTPGSAPAVAVPVGACFQEGSLLDAAAVASCTAVATADDTVVLELRCAALAALAPLAPRLAASVAALAAARDAAVTPAALRAAAWPLQRLDDEALTALAAASSIEVLQPGDALCVRGGACPGLAVVLAGQAAVTRRLLAGGETVTTITAGGAFGADSLVTAGQGGAEVEVQAAGAAPTVLLLLPHAALLPPALPPPACADDAAFARAAAKLGVAAAAWRAAAGADALAAHWLLHVALPDAVQRASATSALAASALPLPLGAPAHLPSPRALGALIPVADVDIADEESGTANAACPGDGAWAAVGELAPGAAATSPALLRAGPAALAALLSRDAFANAVGAEGLARAAAAAGALAAASSALRAAGVASGRAVALRRGEAAFAPHSADDAAVLLHGRLAPPYDDVATGTLLLRSQAAQAAMPTQLAAALGGGRVAEGTCGGDVGSVLLPAALGSRPAASGAPVLGGAAVLGGALTVQLPALSPGAEPASPVFAWLADGAPIARACKATYAPEPADVGRALAVRCRAAPWHDESVLAAVPAKVPLEDASAARDAALAAVAARGCAAFACSVSAARGGAAASLEGEACVLELSAAGARLARPGAAAEQRSRLATLLFGDGSVTVASAAWGAPGLALCGARGDGDAPCGAYLQVHADCHVMLKFASPRERNGALAAARALAARRRKPLPAL